MSAGPVTTVVVTLLVVMSASSVTTVVIAGLDVRSTVIARLGVLAVLGADGAHVGGGTC
jgi:hypothetical protein